MPGDLMCVTSGVPAAYACPALMDAFELELFHPIFTTSGPLSVEAADLIGLLVKSHETVSVYNTHGGISDDGQLISQVPSWTITSNHRRNLKKIAKRFTCSLDECVRVDQSFRIKRARGGPVNITDSLGKTRCVVWYQTTTAKYGDHLGSWFDITLTDEAPDRHWLESAAEKAPRTRYNQHVKTELARAKRLVRQCGYCRSADSKEHRHLKCARCKGVAYCSKECQRADWKMHRKICRAP